MFYKPRLSYFFLKEHKKYNFCEFLDGCGWINYDIAGKLD